jgi:lipid-A-disaccharide synthase-like uncharacterized protein
MNPDIIRYRKTIISRSFWTAAVLGALLTMLGQKSYAFGVVTGTALSAVNFFLLSFQIAGVGRKSTGAAPIFVFFIIRYGLMGAVIYWIFRSAEVNIIGFVIGFFLLQAQIFLASLFQKKTV